VDVSAGNAIRIIVGWNTAAGSASVVDSQGNTYAATPNSLVNGGDFTASLQQFTATAGGNGPNTVTATTPSNANGLLWLYEVLNLDNVSPNDVAGSVDALANATVTFNTNADDEFIIAGRITSSLNTPAGWVQDSAPFAGIGAAYHKQDPTPAGSVSYAATADGSLSVAAYKIAGGGAASQPVWSPHRMPMGA
jgi:hypothetical protein